MNVNIGDHHSGQERIDDTSTDSAKLGTRHPSKRPALPTIELRQLRYFVTVAEELHFGRAAAREHIAQSAMSQQIQRLERSIGVALVTRTTRHTALSPAGIRFLLEARQILSQMERAVSVARGTAATGPVLRIGLLEEGYEALRPVVHQLIGQRPDIEIHQVRAGVPQQCSELLNGRIDVGIGRAAVVPPEIATELFRLDPLGVLIPEEHPLAPMTSVPVTRLKGERLLLPDDQQAPEFTMFMNETCQLAGFSPDRFPGRAPGLRAAADLVERGCCLMVLCESSVDATEGQWRPLSRPDSLYPWSLLWRSQDPPSHVRSLITTTREVSRENGWI